MYFVTMQRRAAPTLWLAGIMFLAGLPTASGQQDLPQLEQVRLAAEKGDPEAQYRFGQNYYGQFKFSQAVEWFRKSADQGFVDAQYTLGQMLMDGRAKSVPDSLPVPRAPHEAIKWLLLAANQGHRSAQLELARCFESGKAVNQDSVEAYKWYKLAGVNLDGLVLRMTHDQIQKGEERARNWKARLPTNIVLKGILTAGNRRLAIVNGITLEKGGETKIKIGQRFVSVRCLEIKEKSVVLSIEVLTQPKEISLE